MIGMPAPDATSVIHPVQGRVRHVAATGNGPFPRSDFLHFLQTQGLQQTSFDGRIVPDILVVGRERFDRNRARKCLQEMGQMAITCSQETMLAWIFRRQWPGGEVCYTERHKGVAWAKAELESLRGNVLLMPTANNGKEERALGAAHVEDPWQYNSGFTSADVLFWMDYADVGKNLSIGKRRKALRASLSLPVDGINPDATRQDRERWGRPRSSGRLYHIVSSISAALKKESLRGVPVFRARKQWRSDLDWLYQTRYPHHAKSFQWPS